MAEKCYTRHLLSDLEFNWIEREKTNIYNLQTCCICESYAIVWPLNPWEGEGGEYRDKGCGLIKGSVERDQGDEGANVAEYSSAIFFVLESLTVY